MNRCKKLIFLLLMAYSVKAQSLHFVYFQSENGAPFYVKIKSSIYSSTESGYLILSKLEEGKYPLIIGFPGNQLPSQNFDFEIKKDENRGFIIKSGQPAMFSLIDFKTSSPLLPIRDTAETSPKDTVIQKNKDEFSKTLAMVTDNPSILEEDEFEGNNGLGKSNISSSQNIIMVFSKKEPAGLSMKYLIKEGVKIDTILIFIPYENKKKKEKAVLKNTCNEIASDADFIQLRRKMTAEDNEKKMIAVAKNSFAEKCYTSDQIKYLSALFTNEDDRIDFLQAAYPSVIDKMNFSALESLLTLEKNKSRFRSILQP